MAQARQGDTVRVHYTGTLEDGTVFDSSRPRSPLQFTIGQGRILPGFEQQVIGMSPGESRTATLPPERAYGPHDDERVLEIERVHLPQGLEPEVGQRLQMVREDGESLPIRVTAVSDSSVTVDANHPLAGRSLTFEIELVEIV